MPSEILYTKLSSTFLFTPTTTCAIWPTLTCGAKAAAKTTVEAAAWHPGIQDRTGQEEERAATAKLEILCAGCFRQRDETEQELLLCVFVVVMGRGVPLRFSLCG